MQAALLLRVAWQVEAMARQVDALSTQEDSDGPLTFWTAIAKALRVSTDTLARRRKERDDTTAPYFPDPDAARAWYPRLLSPPSSPSKPRKPRSPHTGGAQGRTLADLRAERCGRKRGRETG
ncbi:MAG: hypothetical protein JRI25_01765 [Deltaproteobacteria bacterium]|nr:hypothetical protein [Deltaproteobacteria bacterium]